MSYTSNAGIYKITNIANNKVYIGQSINVRKRLMTHKSTLIKGNHHNSVLQRAFNKYGLENFHAELIEECSMDNIDQREIYWIRFYDSTNRNKGYNFDSGGNLNKIMHEETKESIRLANRGRNNILSKADVREIKTALHIGILQSELADIFCVNISTINKIAKAKNWEWVLPQFNDTQSIEVDYFKEKMNIRVLQMFENGLSAIQIQKQTPYTKAEIQNVLNGKVAEITKEKHENIISDYDSGMSKDDIANKYSLNRWYLNKILVEKNKQEHSQKVKKIKYLSEQGYKNSEISSIMGMHRTSVTDILKGRTKEVKRKRVNFTDELKKQILDLIKQGFSQRKVSETLDISRANVRKAIELDLS